MADVLQILPNFRTEPHTNLLAACDRLQLSTADLLGLDPAEFARQAHAPISDVHALIAAVAGELHAGFGFTPTENSGQPGGKTVANGATTPVKTLTTSAGPLDDAPSGSTGLSGPNADGGISRGDDSAIGPKWETIGLLDPRLDCALGGGLPTGRVTEITGESGAGKTQMLLTLLLSVQLPPPDGLAATCMYISTESPLPTKRLQQMLQANPQLRRDKTALPSLSRILTLTTPDLESQEHIIQFQLPVAIRRHRVRLVVLDSVAANFRAELDAQSKSSSSIGLVHRSGRLARLGSQLRSLAREHNICIVVANQVADRFQPVQYGATDLAQSQPAPGLPSLAPSADLLSLDHQQRWFTGWGDLPGQQQLKTPSLGLVWANQLAGRIALTKEPVLRSRHVINDSSDEMTPSAPTANWQRRMRVVFASWTAPTQDAGVVFELTASGVKSIADGEIGTMQMVDIG